MLILINGQTINLKHVERMRWGNYTTSTIVGGIETNVSYPGLIIEMASGREHCFDRNAETEAIMAFVQAMSHKVSAE